MILRRMSVLLIVTATRFIIIQGIFKSFQHREREREREREIDFEVFLEK